MLRRWLVASLLSSTKWFYWQMLAFVGIDNAPSYCRDVMRLTEEVLEG